VTGDYIILLHQSNSWRSPRSKYRPSNSRTA